MRGLNDCLIIDRVYFEYYFHFENIKMNGGDMPLIDAPP